MSDAPATNPEDEVGYKQDHNPDEKGRNQQDLEEDPEALDDTLEDDRPSGKIEPEA